MDGLVIGTPGRARVRVCARVRARVYVYTSSIRVGHRVVWCAT